MIRSLADAGQIDSVLPGYRMFVPTWKFFLLRLALAFLVIAWLDPKMGSRLQEVESEGVDMMVALDVSNSMMTEDVAWRGWTAGTHHQAPRCLHLWRPTRLVVFAGEAYVQCPLTTDVDALTCSWNRSTQAWSPRKERLWDVPWKPAGKDSTTAAKPPA